MIIFCDSGGNVNSIPSTIPFGSAQTDITIVAFEMAATAVLRIKPPNQQYAPGIVCTPVIQDGVVVYQAKLNKAVTNTFGRCEYQVDFYLQDGDEVPNISTYSGSFNVSRGVPIDLPASEELLKDMALENIYAALSSVTMLAEEIGAVMGFVGVGTELQTAAKNLAGAVNELFARPVVDVDNTLTVSGGAADAKVTGDRINTLNTEKINITDIVDNLTTNDAKKPLSAAQGVILKGLVTELQTALDTLKNSVVSVDNITKAIGEHNQNENAHPYIQSAIVSLAETVSKIDVEGVTDRKIGAHNTSDTSHQDIRVLLSELQTKITNFLDIDVDTLNQLSELITAIEDNAEDIENLTVNKVKYSDIIDNLETSLATKVLSANQGVVLKGLIDALSTALDAHKVDTEAHPDIRTELDRLDDFANDNRTRILALEEAQPDMSAYVTKTEFETALGAYITDLDNIVGDGIETEEEVTLISFTVDGTTYQAVDGMTWAEWIESDYNTSGKDWSLDTSTDYVHIVEYVDDTYKGYVDASGVISNGGTYKTSDETVSPL